MQFVAEFSLGTPGLDHRPKYVSLRLWKNVAMEEGFCVCSSDSPVHEVKWNDILMQPHNFIDTFLPRYVSGSYAYHQEH